MSDDKHYISPKLAGRVKAHSVPTICGDRVSWRTATTDYMQVTCKTCRRDVEDISPETMLAFEVWGGHKAGRR